MTTSVLSIGVFCGSNSGTDRVYADSTVSLGQILAERNIRLVYGGGDVGLMGILADATLAAGGEVHGVITRALEAKEVAHGGLTSLVIVETMHERKALMADSADAFIMLPGGFGTLDEFFEAVTWTQLGIHHKPCGLLNANGYFDSLVAFIETAASQRFIQEKYEELVLVASEPNALIDGFATWQGPLSTKWLDRHAR
jgi:uncharacterized protein (TIGR00730 family)